MFIEYALEHNGKDLKCKIGDHMRISLFFCQKKFFLSKTSKIQYHGHVLIGILIAKKLLKRLIKKLQAGIWQVGRL